MNFKKLSPIFFLVVLSTLAQGISISCDCSDSKCSCTSDCSFGFLDIYQEECNGLPDYELSLSNGEINWLPPEEGEYYLRILCDNSKKSNCELLRVPTPKIGGSREKYLPYLFPAAFVAMVALLIYFGYQRKKELQEIKRNVKK